VVYNNKLRGDEMKVYSFEKLEVWKISKEFVKYIYKITDKFSYNERRGIIDQLQRAALSIPNNLAEGSGRITAKDKAKYTHIAYGS
jgi:four helix bundle protein